MPKRWMGLIALGLLLFHAGARTAAAEPESGDKRLLMEKGLAVYELDREIGRLEDERRQLNVRLEETGRQVEQAAKQVEERKKKTGDVIRSYYSGERNALWAAALNVRTFQDALYVWDQLQFIWESDRDAIGRYMERYEELKKAKTEMEDQRLWLEAAKSAYAAEKAKRLQAQAEVDRLLAANAERLRLENEMEGVRTQWEERGLPLFERYFSALSESMQHVPELFGQNGGTVSVKGLSPKVTVADDELNRFLQNKSKELAGFSFRFEDDSVTAGGKSGAIDISVKGRYAVENKPVNAVKFFIDRLSFNGYAMPDSTAKSLERKFDLAFYPSKLAPFLQATDVSIERGRMTVTLRIGL
ncbi:coiled-coil domain-containing protein [Paenibacillus sp. GYB003]|uniref:coiled-coil domain-containing protein n=1 Tax=Paenibacillus sp. GYB003 TaxID=2994392 RepID=UPI002F965B30